METAYNILHLTGAFCLIVFSATGFALIIRWWNRLAIMEAQIRFIFEIQNELLLKSRGQTPKRSHFDKGFFEKGEDIVMSGHPPDGTIVLDGEKFRERMAVLSWLKNDGAGVGDSLNLPKMKNPPPVPPKKRTTEKSTTTETRND